MSGIVGLPGSKSGLIDSGGTIGAGIGKYTPVISRVGSAPSGSPPANQMLGQYRTIGDVCFISIEATFNGFSGGSGQWYVTAPFKNVGEYQGMTKARIYLDGDSADRQLRLHKNTNQIRIHVPSNDSGYNSNTTYVIIYCQGCFIFR